jgi:hypothetical protein
LKDRVAMPSELTSTQTGSKFSEWKVERQSGHAIKVDRYTDRVQVFRVEDRKTEWPMPSEWTGRQTEWPCRQSEQLDRQSGHAVRVNS